MAVYGLAFGCPEVGCSEFGCPEFGWREFGCQSLEPGVWLASESGCLSVKNSFA